MGAETDDTVRLPGRRGRQTRVSRWLPWVGAGVLVLAVAGGAAWWWLPSAPPPPPQQQQVAFAPPAPVPAPAPPPPYAPPLASEAEILADQPDQLAIYRFSLQPAVVVLQFPSLAQQAAMLNRAAALIEKAGFPRDRVVSWTDLDARIAASGGTSDTFYYGHDYRAADLARFFSLATGLDGGEQTLLDLTRKLGWDAPGANGALISLVKQSSAPDLDASARATILHHELSHGLYFTDPAYAAYCQHFWSDVMTSAERASFVGFLGREGYDTDLSDLMINETQAYLINTPDPRFFSAAAVGLPAARVAQLRQSFVAGMPPGWLRDSAEARFKP